MLSFSKGFNNQKDVNTTNYAKIGRMSPEDIIRRKYENNCKNLIQQQAKPVNQVNNGAKLYNKLNDYNRNLNK